MTIQMRNLSAQLQAAIRSAGIALSPLANIIYVDSASPAAGTGRIGTDPNNPLATVNAALEAGTSGVVANNGDLIVVMPGHSETLTAPITMDVAGVTVLCLGNGTNQPTFTVAGAIDGVTFTAANTRWVGGYFPAASAAATATFNVAESDVTISSPFLLAGANDVDMVTITADGERPTFEGFNVIVTANGPDSLFKFEGVVDRPTIRGNNVIGSDGTNAYDDGIIDFNSVAVTNPQIYGNVFSGGGVACAVAAGASLVVGAVYADNTYAAGADDPASAFYVDGLGYRVTKSHNLTSDNADLFTVTGKCLVTLLTGEVTTVVATTTTYQMRVKTTTEPLFLATTITDDAVGTVYLWSGQADAVLNAGVAPTTRVGTTSAQNDDTVDRSPALSPAVIGLASGSLTIESDTSGAGTGVIAWTLFYKPLEPGARIVAA